MTVEERVKKVLIESALKDVNPDELSLQTPLIEYGIGLDSVATLELIIALEIEFQVRVDETEITPETFKTIENLSKYIAPKI